jgi:TolB-like protein/Tfp pilus assembly protein PilF
MSLFQELLQELRRRNVFKVATVYVVTGWLLMQVGSVVMPTFDAPAWVMKAFLVLLLFGFIIAIILAWAFEITPDGIKKESDIPPEQSAHAHTGRKLDFIIIGILLVGVTYFIYESRFASPANDTVAVENKNIPELTADIIKEPEGSSIAVLPFVNMSSDPEQEYFSDGISEEILNVLAKIPKLHVTSRSSSFFYKGSKINISEVASKLGVNNILEGSVRKSGNRIRITAQLIEASSDTHLWSETYDRELTDIFAIQDDISAAIVTALRGKLGLHTNVEKRDMSKVNLDAHNEYLQGRFYIENRNQNDLEKALAHFNKAIELAPDYAPAWMGKGWASLFLSETNYGSVLHDLALQNARSALEKALQLDPNLAEAHGIMGLVEVEFFSAEKAIAHFENAIALNPNYADAYVWYAQSLNSDPKKATGLSQKAVTLSPMSILANNNYANLLIFSAGFGQIQQAREVAEHMLSINSSHHFPYEVLSKILLTEGKYAEAILAFEKGINHSPEKVNLKVETAFVLATIGLNEQAAGLVKGTNAEPLKYWLNGNNELFVSKMRATYPRSESDSFGYMLRGFAEVYAENYRTAVDYFKLTEIDQTSKMRIYSYQQTGLIDEAKNLLESDRLVLNPWLEAKEKFYFSSNMFQPIELKIMEIAHLQGDINKAIANLKEAMKKDYIVNFEYKNNPIYKNLRAHPDWPAIIAESDKRAAIQRERYLKLSAESESESEQNKLN